jgi:hypothetical protein
LIEVSCEAACVCPWRAGWGWLAAVKITAAAVVLHPWQRLARQHTQEVSVKCNAP